jgi:hypothetical protein
VLQRRAVDRQVRQRRATPGDASGHPAAGMGAERHPVAAVARRIDDPLAGTTGSTTAATSVIGPRTVLSACSGSAVRPSKTAWSRSVTTSSLPGAAVDAIARSVATLLRQAGVADACDPIDPRARRGRQQPIASGVVDDALRVAPGLAGPDKDRCARGRPTSAARACGARPRCRRRCASLVCR